MKNKIKYLIIIVLLIGGLYCLQMSLSNGQSPTRGDIKQDDNDNGKQILDDQGKVGENKETIKGQIDKSQLTEEELKEYESYDPFGKNANGQETEGQ